MNLKRSAYFRLRQTKALKIGRTGAANLQKHAQDVETCMRAAGYRITGECSAPLVKTYESCMKIADEVMRGPEVALTSTATPIGIKFASTMNGTCGPKSGY